MGPLAIMAAQAGMEVYGSDIKNGAISDELKVNRVKFQIGEQDGEFLRKTLEKTGIDWFIHTSALPQDHPELLIAKQQGLRISKRDELIQFLIENLNLKLVAVAGTHGKTTVVAMLIWVAKQLKLPISYLVGTNLSFGQAGEYDKKSQFFVYEADEYDRNFLHFKPWLAVIPSISYDHPDIYKTPEEYQAAFEQFEEQSAQVIRNVAIDQDLTLPGVARRYDATLALEASERMLESMGYPARREQIIEILNRFPGARRRFEQIADGIYTDYAHHPEEISATIELALEEARRLKKSGVIAIYEPHQNTRQHELFDGYREAFIGVNKLYWLPTFLTRENPDLVVFQPGDFIKGLANASVGEEAELGEELARRLLEVQEAGYLVILMSAGPADQWMRAVFKKNQKKEGA